MTPHEYQNVKNKAEINFCIITLVFLTTLSLLYTVPSLHTSREKELLVELKLQDYMGFSCIKRHPNLELIMLSGMGNSRVQTTFCSLIFFSSYLVGLANLTLVRVSKYFSPLLRCSGIPHAVQPVHL